MNNQRRLSWQKTRDEIVSAVGEPAWIDSLLRLTEMAVSCLREGGTLYLFGNGGSAADAQHVAAELVNRFLRDRRALPAVALTTDPSVVTSIANDIGYEAVFARQIEALGRPGDLAIGISTSGRSANVVAGLKTAAQRGLHTAAFTGPEPGPVGEIAQAVVAVPGKSTPMIQTLHLIGEHLLCQWIEEDLG